jgi:S1-C subfamily serine protease
MSYAVAQQTGDTVTYGWKIATVASNGPSNGKLQVGDIIIAMNGVTIKSNDDLASYLEEHTLPGDTITLTVVRDKAETLVDVTLGIRPAAT